jgi:hypothetical protein
MQNAAGEQIYPQQPRRYHYFFPLDMGLEIFYDLHTPEAWTQSKVRQTVLAARRHALAVGFHEGNQVERNNPLHPRTMGVRRLPKDLHWLSADAEDGWYFRTWPGEGCKTAIFGLCKFPARIMSGERSIAFGWGDGWHFHAGCKTQYADMVSRASILDSFQSAGCKVHVRDGGDFWKSRRVERLTSRLQDMHAVVAAIAGAIKDADENPGGQFIAPIARHPNFEHLEAKGLTLLNQNHRRKPSG